LLLHPARSHQNLVREGLHVVLSRREANALLEIVDAGLRSGSEEDVRRLVLRLQDLIPFEFALCAFSGTSYSSTEPHRIINVSYPDSWLQLYMAEQFDRIDPIIAEHRLHFDLQYWSDSYEKHEGPKKFIACAEAHGLKAGYSYGLKTEGGNAASLFSFGAKSVKRVHRTCEILRRIVPHLHQALIRVLGRKGNGPHLPKTPLSPREKEVLKWVKEGKNAWDISKILAISESTVKFHVANILRKFDARTRAQAVAIGVEEHLIDI
jgi:LuxR family transcriptional regulator, quorum-sensing system regulator CviR